MLSRFVTLADMALAHPPCQLAGTSAQRLKCCSMQQDAGCYQPGNPLVPLDRRPAVRLKMGQVRKCYRKRTQEKEAESFLRWGAVAAPNPAKHWSKLMAAPAPAQKPKPSPLPNATPGNYPPAVRYASSHPYPTGIEPLVLSALKKETLPATKPH